MAGGLLGPDSFPIRDPRSPKQINGRIINPPRYAEFGGLDGPGKWPKANDAPRRRTDSDFTNAAFAVKKPTGLKASHATTNRND